MPEFLVYNIRKEKYAHSLIASGAANRWNKEQEYVIYTGSSRALSALELVVHRSSIDLGSAYKLLVITINAEENDIQTVGDLRGNWHSLANYNTLQAIGSRWYQAREKLLLKVPSAIIPKEFNYLINTSHPDFLTKVRILEKEDFTWDNRLM